MNCNGFLWYSKYSMGGQGKERGGNKEKKSHASKQQRTAQQCNSSDLRLP
jgi:hypothetical protein